jgi:hypothetical protein
MAKDGFEVRFAVVNLIGMQLIDGDEGLENFLDRWRDCVAGVKHLPDRSEHQDLFVMRKSEFAKLYVRDFDEMPAWGKRETWEWLEERGRSMRERERARANQQETISALHGKGQGKPKATAWPSLAVPGEEGNPGERPKGESEKKPKGEGQGNSRSSDGMSGSDGARTPKWGERKPTPTDKRRANRPCWFYAAGGCSRGNFCSRDHRKLIDDEK